MPEAKRKLTGATRVRKPNTGNQDVQHFFFHDVSFFTKRGCAFKSTF
jgi:hypothetical protein